MGIELGLPGTVEEVCGCAADSVTGCDADCVADWILDVTVKLVLAASESTVGIVATKVAAVHGTI